MTCDDGLEDDRHDRADGGAGYGEERSDARPDDDWQTPPPGEENDGRNKDRDKVHADTGQEGPEHNMTCNSDQLQDSVDLRGESDCGAGQELAQQDFNWIEPKEGLRLRAVRNAFIIVTLTEAPQPNLVKIVEAERACEGARKLEVSRRGRDYIGEVQLEDVSRADDDLLIDGSDQGL